MLNIAYNLLLGGITDIELLRNDDTWLDALDTLIIPVPITWDDFLRRFDEGDIIELMEVKNITRQKQPNVFFKQPIINVDSTICLFCT